MSRKTIGTEGENIAGEFLKNRGLSIITGNYSNHLGEIDIIARDNGELVFVEVKTKSGDSFGRGYEMVNTRKKSKLRKISKVYLLENNYDPEGVPWRIDVVAVDRKSGQIDWFKNAVFDE